jgi:hypothetical protein
VTVCGMHRPAATRTAPIIHLTRFQLLAASTIVVAPCVHLTASAGIVAMSPVTIVVAEPSY